VLCPLTGLIRLTLQKQRPRRNMGHRAYGAEELRMDQFPALVSTSVEMLLHPVNADTPVDFVLPLRRVVRPWHDRDLCNVTGAGAGLHKYTTSAAWPDACGRHFSRVFGG